MQRRAYVRAHKMELGVSVSFGRSLIEYTYHAQRGLSLGLKELHQEAANLSNSSLNCSCDKLLEDSKDGNIPFILGVSFAAWLVIFCVFVIIRYCAPDYSRVGVLSGGRSARALYVHKGSTLLKDEDATKLVSVDLPSENHWYSWIVSYFRLNSEDVKLRCGPDATVYLALERYLILLFIIFMVPSLLIILPINYLVDKKSSADGFARTTISNVPPESGLLWVHTIFSMIYLIVTVVFMIRFSLKLGKHQKENSTHTVMVQWIPTYVHREDLMQHFQEAFSESRVADIQLAYDVAQLTKLSNRLVANDHALESVESIENELGVQENIRVGWNKLCFWSKERLVKACAHYEGLHAALEEAADQEKQVIRGKRLGIGFVTFNRQRDATEFHTSYKIFRQHPKSTMYDSIRGRWWWVSMAPFPRDIMWHNLSIPYVMWWLRWLLINLVLLGFIIFFTTPPIILSSLDEIRVRFINATNFPTITSFQTSPYVRGYLSSLILLLFAFFLPFCVSRSSYLEGHWTKTVREQTIARKLYMFLVLMLLLLPSIGLTSLSALGQLAFKGEAAVDCRLQCIFLPNNGAFFLGYVIMAAFIGTSIELLRLPELLEYIYRRLRAKTRMQKDQALCKASRYDFMYGVQYAWNLAIFNMVMSYSLTTPLIVPFGVLYFVLKYLVDKYNIYYVYRPESFNGRQFLHRTALNFVIVGAVHLQLATMFFSVVRLGKFDPRTIISIVIFSVTVAVCVAVMGLGWFSHLLPKLKLKMGHEYRVFTSMQAGGAEDQDEPVMKGAYIPNVLKNLPDEAPDDNSVNGYQSFGSTDRMGRTSPSSPSKDEAQPLVSSSDKRHSATLRRSSFNESMITPIPEEDECESDRSDLTKLLI